MARASGKFVVLYNQVAHVYTRGQVVSGDDLNGELQRYLDLKAVRPATAEEAGLAQVTLDEVNRPYQSIDAKLAALEAECERLRRRVAELEEKLSETARKTSKPRVDRALAEEATKVQERQKAALAGL